ncbi:MAG TPA: aldehyde dehydrogenase [Draconibacterium sp.]|nr:aldehyde dehydrogenase [Draconibacterium sp.]
MTNNQLAAIIENQQNFFNSHQTLDFNFRKSKLLQLKKVIKELEKEILEALNSDLGKCEFEAFFTEIGLVQYELTNHIRNLKKWAKPKKVPTPLFAFPSVSYIYKQPFGKVLVIAPFNYPFMLAFMPLIGAIAAGNVVVVKPSEFTSKTAAVIEKIIKAVFDPAHVSVVQGGVEISQYLLTQRWDKIFFTGSSKVGEIVMQAAAQHLTPVILELGGKNPTVVDKDANLEVAARRIILGKLINSGQTCIAPDYLFVHHDVKEELLGLLKAATEQFFSLNPEENKEYPKIVHESAIERLKNLIDGTTVFSGGQANSSIRYFSPTILTDVTFDSPVMKSEIFGPVLPVITFNNIDEVVEFIQDGEKPLSVYYFGEDRKKQKDFLQKTYSGNAGINEVAMQFLNLSLPFGGVGSSGMGTYHGRNSFNAFSHERSVIKTTTRIDLPLRYPPFKNAVLRLMRFLFR